MKSFRITMAALVGTASLVIAFAFTSKPLAAVDAVYSPITPGKNVTLKGQTNSIIQSELKVDYDFDRVPDAWTITPIGGGVSGGTKLLGIEYQSTDYIDLLGAATAVYNYYSQSSITDFPANGVYFQDPMAPSKSITVYRKN